MNAIGKLTLDKVKGRSTIRTSFGSTIMEKKSPECIMNITLLKMTDNSIRELPQVTFVPVPYPVEK